MSRSQRTYRDAPIAVPSTARARLMIAGRHEASRPLKMLSQVVTYNRKRKGTTDCKVLQAYLSESLSREEDFLSYALGGCTADTLIGGISASAS